MVIDSILSREWAHWGNPRFFQRIYMKEESVAQLPDFCIRRDSVGVAAGAIFPKEESMEFWKGGWYPKPPTKTRKTPDPQGADTDPTEEPDE